jgi:hypothetical protein
VFLQYKHCKKLLLVNVKEIQVLLKCEDYERFDTFNPNTR